MPHTPKHLLFPPFHDALPAPVVFRTGYMPADAAYPRHRHIWGEFVYSYSGVVQVDVGQRRYLTPSHYGLWLPPGVEHQGLNRQAACHCSLYIAAHQASALPDITCALTVGPLTRALLEHLRHHPAEAPYPDDLTRLLDVLVDQLAVAECAGSYLPTSADPQLRRALQRLEDDPTATASVGELAKAVHVTERTLLRRAQRDLGMTLTEWRQRLKVVKAMPMLESGAKVEAIAMDLGYASASAFIAMFRRLTGQTPDEYRRGQER